MRVDIYILAKDEEINIARAVSSARGLTEHVWVLDSGSTDRTSELAKKNGAEIILRPYISHCETYNYLTTSRHPAEIIMVLDADMRLSEQAFKNAIEVIQNGSAEAVLTNVVMYWEGVRLKHASLYPPKPFAFKRGQTYFEPVGHGERLNHLVKRTIVAGGLVHDDRKGFQAFIGSQVRYSSQFVQRLSMGNTSFRDRMRAATPIVALASPIYSYIIRQGYRDGKAGIIYALDRAIAELICFRQAMLKRLEAKNSALDVRD